MKDKKPDGKSADDNGWFYSEKVKEHFFNPKNILMDESDLEESRFNGKGVVGSPACGDMMYMWIRVDPKTGRIKECRWKTFGCASAIASTSALSEMVTEKGGMKIDDALKIRPKDIVERLGGLPQRKIHCSVLGDQALRAAIDDYLKRTVERGKAKR